MPLPYLCGIFSSESWKPELPAPPTSPWTGSLHLGPSRVSMDCGLRAARASWCWMGQGNKATAHTSLQRSKPPRQDQRCPATPCQIASWAPPHDGEISNNTSSHLSLCKLICTFSILKNVSQSVLLTNLSFHGAKGVHFGLVTGAAGPAEGSQVPPRNQSVGAPAE